MRNWSSKILSQADKEGGGIKSVILEINGEGSYDELRWESGVHRVQRIPATESGGRVHTSTVQVVVCLFIRVKALEPLNMGPLRLFRYLKTVTHDRMILRNSLTRKT